MLKTDETDMANLHSSLEILLKLAEEDLPFSRILIRLCLNKKENFTTTKAMVVKYVAPVIMYDLFNDEEYLKVLKLLFQGLLNPDVTLIDENMFGAAFAHTIPIEQSERT
jgi:hypothetical protein